MAGERRRNDPSLSSASTTISRPLPSFALDPSAFSFPPTTAVGSRPAWATTVAIREVVVVFPCEPAMATPSFRRISSASISARGITGMPRSLAAITGIVLLHGAGGDHHVHVGRHVLCPVPGADDPAQRGEAPGDLALLEVGSAHPVAEVQQELGDAAHADSPDPDEVDLDLLVAEHCAPLQVTYCECTRFDLR